MHLFLAALVAFFVARKGNDPLPTLQSNLALNDCAVLELDIQELCYHATLVCFADLLECRRRLRLISCGVSGCASEDAM